MEKLGGGSVYSNPVGGTGMHPLKKIATGALLWSGLVIGGCHVEPPSVAVIPRTTSTLLWEPMHMGVEERARRSGIHVYWNAPPDEGDAEKQLAFVTSSMHEGYRGLILAPDETLTFRTVVLKAVNEHIPVVIVDDELGPPAGPFLSYVSNDEAAGARLAATRVASVLHGQGSIAVMGISPRLEGGLTREEYFERELASIAPEIHIQERRFGDTVVAHQQQIAQEILNEDQHIDAIIALSSAATRGAYYAKIATEPHSSTVIVGFDQDLLAPIQLGEVDSVIVQNTLAIGEKAMQNLEAQMRGDKVADLTTVPPLLLNKENLRSAEFEKLWSFGQYQWSTK